MSLDWIAKAGKPLRGRIRVPGDKSISHRSMMLGSLASGVTEVEGFLEGEDTRATAAAFRAMGVRIDGDGGRRTVFGAGAGGLKAPAQPLDLGNSGTGMRLMAGILAAQPFHSTLVGDESLSRRPMKRVVEPLRRMGASIATKEGGLAPLAFAPVDALKAIDHVTDVPSAQVKSCVLLAGLHAQGTTRVREAHPTRDHSERMLRAFGADVRINDGWIEIDGGAKLEGARIVVPGDFSSAAFFLVAASIVPDSDLVIEGVGVNPLRTGLLQALWSMGARIEVEDERTEGGEPVADLHVRHAPLHGVEVPEAIVPDMIDEFPALFAAAAVAEGRTIVRGAAELRVKESDRIAAMASALRAMGATIEETPDGAVIEGGTLKGGAVDSRGDHRIAMASAVAAQRVERDVVIRDCANVATSFPGFVELSQSAGLDVAIL